MLWRTRLWRVWPYAAPSTIALALNRTPPHTPPLTPGRPRRLGGQMPAQAVTCISATRPRAARRCDRSVSPHSSKRRTISSRSELSRLWRRPPGRASSRVPSARRWVQRHARRRQNRTRGGVVDQPQQHGFGGPVDAGGDRTAHPAVFPRSTASSTSSTTVRPNRSMRPNASDASARDSKTPGLDEPKAATAPSRTARQPGDHRPVHTSLSSRLGPTAKHPHPQTVLLPAVSSFFGFLCSERGCSLLSRTATLPAA